MRVGGSANVDKQEVGGERGGSYGGVGWDHNSKQLLSRSHEFCDNFISMNIKLVNKRV